MPTIVRYNNVEIYNCRIREFRQDVVYDDSGTDYLYTRFSITVEGIVGTHETGPGTWLIHGEQKEPVERETTQKRLQDLFIALREPRKRLTILVRNIRLVNGEWRIVDDVILDVYPADTTEQYVTRDFKNGPQPQEFRILSIMGSRLCSISWRVDCCVLQRPDDQYQRESTHGWPPDNPDPTILSNRWSVEEAFDVNFAITRTIRGCLVQSKPFSLTSFTQRLLCWPALEPGFRRESCRFAFREDGTRLDYEIVDKQIKDAAPWPCTTMQVTHRRRVQDGVTCLAGVQITLTAPPVVPRYMLVRRAVQIADFFLKIRQRANSYGSAWLINNCEIVEEFGEECRVSLNLEIQTVGSENYEGLDFVRAHLFACGWEMKEIEAGINDIPKLPQEHNLPYPYGNQLYHPYISWKGNPYGYTAVPVIDTRGINLLQTFMNFLQYPYSDDKSMPSTPEEEGWQARKPTSGENNGESKQEGTQATEGPDFHVEGIVYRTDNDFDPYENLWPDFIVGKYAENHVLGLYTYTRVSDTYVMQLGRHALRLSEPSTSNRILVQIGAPAAIRRLVYDTERIGQMPELPALTDFTTDLKLPGGQTIPISGWIIKGPKVELFPPVLSPTGDAYIYRVRAKVVWALDKLPPSNAALPVCVRGYVATPVEQQQYGGLLLAFNPRLGPVVV